MGLKDTAVGGLVILVEFDCVGIGGTLQRFTNNGQSIEWGGVVFTPNPVDITEMSSSVSGAPPAITVSMSNITGILTDNLVQTIDFVGAKIRRIIIDRESVGTSDNPVKPVEEYTVNNSARDGYSVALECTTVLATYNIEVPTKRMLIDDYPALGRVF